VPVACLLDQEQLAGDGMAAASSDGRCARAVVSASAKDAGGTAYLRMLSFFVHYRWRAPLQSAFRKEFEKDSAKCRRITTRSVVVDILKNGPLSARHTLADRFTDQREVWLRFLPPHDERRPDEILQHVACDRRRRPLAPALRKFA
jgi:hypothetical protein